MQFARTCIQTEGERSMAPPPPPPYRQSGSRVRRCPGSTMHSNPLHSPVCYDHLHTPARMPSTAISGTLIGHGAVPPPPPTQSSYRRKGTDGVRRNDAHGDSTPPQSVSPPLSRLRFYPWALAAACSLTALPLHPTPRAGPCHGPPSHSSRLVCLRLPPQR